GGTLAAFGHDGPAVAARFATRLDLPAPLIPWHTARQPVAALGSALAVATATAAKVTGDVALLMQAEVAEASEPPGRGGSSTLPQKHNPVAATLVDAAARRAAPLAATLAASVVAQHERPAGAWHAEWQPLAELLQLAGGAAAEAAGVVTGLEVHPATMRANLVRLDGPLLAERVVLTLTPLIGREAATAAVAGAAAVTAGGTASFADALGLDGRVRAVLPPAEIARLLDPSGYLGSAGQWVDRALAAYRGEVPVP
ncbi:MAG TPA: lyase family protein, partial [Acidimicrobiales bacterium]|nr:lyase family protein [Acidimicrobiales bacterium]